MRGKKNRFWMWAFRFFISAILALGIGFLPYKAYGPAGIPRVMHLERNLNQINDSNTKLLQENQWLRQAIKSLREDRGAIERVARDELGLVREDDVVFQFE